MSSRRIEDVLLQIGQVRYKKNDGTLYVMKERIVFMVDGKDDRVSVAHNYQDIKSESLFHEFLKSQNSIGSQKNKF